MNPVLNQPLQSFGFLVEITRDGSPTLRLNSNQDLKAIDLNNHTTAQKSSAHEESMHHSAGAASETWYIYGSVLKRVLQALPESERQYLKTTVVGLGLGYIEMVWALLSLEIHLKNNSTDNPNHNPSKSELIENSMGSLDSFEISDDLKINFTEWIQKTVNQMSSIYDLAAEKILQTQDQAEAKNHISIQQIQHVLSHNLDHQFKMHGDVLNIKESKKWNIICFDAFSKKTSQEIWTEAFLNHYLETYCADDCVFTTYACTSDLKRILKKHHFQIIKRDGFSGKRESTLAVRGKFIKVFEKFFQTFSHNQ